MLLELNFFTNSVANNFSQGKLNLLSKLLFAVFIFTSTVRSNGQANPLPDSPLSSYDFTSADWLLLYSEITIDSLNFSKEHQEYILAIDDETILDSLKTELQCNLDKLIDGYHVFVITLISDNQEKEYLVWDNHNHLSLGKLRPFFKPTTHHYYQTENLHKLERKITKWENRGWYIRTNKENRKRGDYYVSAYELKK